MGARIVSLNVGQPRPLAYRGGAVLTGSFKDPVTEPVQLGPTGLAGDAQADLRVHGGPDKAVCVYPTEHLPHWSERLGRRVEIGAFGENFSVAGLLEPDVCVGDVYRVGGALVQVTQPRQPCYKLATRNGEPAFARWVQAAGRTGFYFRCLEPGAVQVGDTIELVERQAPGATIAEVNRVLHRDKHDRAAIERLLAVAALAGSLRRTLAGRLAGEPENLARRLDGVGVEVG
jgi:MOSC domain-containing protein YiiM